MLHIYIIQSSQNIYPLGSISILVLEGGTIKLSIGGKQLQSVLFYFESKMGIQETGSQTSLSGEELKPWIGQDFIWGNGANLKEEGEV